MHPTNPLKQLSSPFPWKDRLEERWILPLPSCYFGKCCMWEKVPGISLTEACIFLLKKKKINKSESNLLIKV